VVTFPSTITDEMQPGTGHERGEALHEFERFQDDVGCAITVGRLQREHHLSGTVECKALVGNGRAGDVAA
jgi:hypothetical protein